MNEILTCTSRDSSVATNCDGWHPVLEGEVALAAADAIVAVSLARARDDEQPRRNPSLLSGEIGLGLLRGYLALTRDNARWQKTAIKHLDSAAEGFGEEPPFASLYLGFPGLAWVWHHFDGRLTEFPADIDTDVWPALMHVLAPERWRGPFDLTHGLVGLGVCALEALRKPDAAEVLEQVVHRLGDIATRTDEHVSWRTSPRHLPRRLGESYPDGRYDLGVAHGTPGVVALLGRAVEAGVAEDAARDLLDRAVPWLLAKALPEGTSTFPPILDADGNADGPARLAWCYGDAGIAVALYGMASRVGRSDWQQSAIDIALKAARRPEETTGVRDAGLCHGAAGLGHLFNRLYQATREPELGDAARFWFEKTLAYRDDHLGIGGFWVLGRNGDGELAKVAAPGFLNGAAGIALALLAATTEVEPLWDRLLLASIPMGESHS